jgi:hypothetical protein
MKETEPTRGLTPPTLEQFRGFVKKIISVPKTEIDKKEAEYRKKRNAKKHSSDSP